MKYLLDTNVISEAKCKNPHIVRWFEQVNVTTHYICAVSLGEISKGAHLLLRRDPNRAAMIFDWLKTVETQFEDRIIAVDQAIANEWGRVAAIRTRGEIVGLIAACSIVHGMTLVTRNVRDFEDCGVELVNPWAGS